MMNLEEIMNLSYQERINRQKGMFRELAIGMWAPREPQIMGMLRNALKEKSDFSRGVISKILDRFFGIGIYTAVATLEEIKAFIRSMPDDFTIVRGPCACRINTAAEAGFDARDMKSGNYNYCRNSPLNLDIQFATCGEKFKNCEGYEPITRDELIALEEEAHNMGLVSNLYVMFGGEGSICHCSSKTCVPLITYLYVCDGRRRIYKKGASIAETDQSRCCGNGTCEEVCHFGARTHTVQIGIRRAVFDPVKCYGCGICADACPEKAIRMVRRNTCGKKAKTGVTIP